MLSVPTTRGEGGITPPKTPFGHRTSKKFLGVSSLGGLASLPLLPSFRSKISAPPLAPHRTHILHAQSAPPPCPGPCQPLCDQGLPTPILSRYFPNSTSLPERDRDGGGVAVERIKMSHFVFYIKEKKQSKLRPMLKKVDMVPPFYRQLCGHLKLQCTHITDNETTSLTCTVVFYSLIGKRPTTQWKSGQRV